MADIEDLLADAREEEAERRIHRINARRWASVNSASLEPPEFICPGCGIDGDCDCPEKEDEHEDEPDETSGPAGRGEPTKAVGPTRIA